MADDLINTTKRVGNLLSGQSAVKSVAGALAPAPAASAAPVGPRPPSLGQLATTGAAVGPTVPTVKVDDSIKRKDF